jgi:hypothetical protein
MAVDHQARGRRAAATGAIRRARAEPYTVHEQVTGLLGHPRPGRVGGHPEDVDPAAGNLDHKQHVQTPEQHRVDVEEVAGQDPLGLRGQELPPAQARAAWRRVDARPLEQQPHGAWRELVTKPCQFAMDAPVAPGRVLSRDPQDQLPQLRRYRRSPSRATGFRPVAPDQVAVHPRRAARRSRPAAAGGSSRAGLGSIGLLGRFARKGTGKSGAATAADGRVVVRR